MKSFEPIRIETEYGPIQGMQRSSTLGREFFSFQGIPYMKAPTGKLRFRDPQPPEKWTEVIDATFEPPSYCFSHPGVLMNSGQENAGVLNVYVPFNASCELLPVLVFLHGGGFQMGSSRTDFYGADYFMEKDVVLVTLNYRVGPFGFLSLNDPALEVPGNAGLKDQNFALKWIQKNIASFGGNHNNVTLFGDGAGGAATHYHMISDQSKGLFQKAIIMSGCAFNKTWSLAAPNDYAQRLGRKVGWDGTGGDSKLLEVLEGADPHDLVQHSTPNGLLTEQEFSEFLIFAFCPVIEPYVTDKTFISKDSILMARDAWSKYVSIIIGAASLEGAFATIFDRSESFIDVFENASYFAPHRELGMKVTEAARFGTRIKKVYFEYAHLTNTNYELFCQFSSDRHFWHGIQNVVKARVNSDATGKNFLYRFDASTELNILKKYNKLDDYPGASHGDTTFYLFSSIFLSPPSPESIEFKMIQKMISLWTNFAINGDPNDSETRDWSPVTSLKPPLNCLNISEKKIELIPLPESDRLMIWDTVYKDAKVSMY